MSGQKAKKQRKKTRFFFKCFFSLLRVREAKLVRDEICNFLMFGVHVVHKIHDFSHFLEHFFHSYAHFTKQKMHDKLQKKCIFWHFAFHYSTKKVFSNIFFCIFLTKKFSIFNFLPHYKKFHFLFFNAHPSANI
jgi:hypothetical protein